MSFLSLKHPPFSSMKHALTLLAVALAFTSAHSAVIYSGLQNIPIPTTFAGVYIDVDTGAHSTSVITGWDVNAFFGGYGLYNSAAFQPARTGTGALDQVIRFNPGDTIGSSLNYSTGTGGSSDHIGGAVNQFISGDEGYIGFKFTTNTSAGPYYGWMRVALTLNTPGGEIIDWAYDDTGASILIPGGVPEPGRASFVMLGLASLLLRRHRAGRLSSPQRA